MSERAAGTAPLACVAACRGGFARARKDGRLAAVLSEFGYHPYLGGADDDAWRDGDAELVVCDVVCPAEDMPVEVALAAMRGVAVIALVPGAVPVDGLPADLLAGCDATILRYDGVEPHRVLHAWLLAGHSARATSREGTPASV
jgi:hypothetical protein